MARPICRGCGRPTTAKYYREHGSRCSACYSLSLLEPFDDARAEEKVQELYRSTQLFDRVVSAMKRIMRPPPGATEWKLHHVVELDSRRMKW